MNIFESHESTVRSYCRSFPVTFDRAEGSLMYGVDKRAYIDFFSGAGALNYGHNHPYLVEALTSYIAHSGVVHSLDLYTRAKERFLEQFVQTILIPHGMDYRLMFPGPTGANAVEAAMKLARKVTWRTNIAAFTGGFHGMTLGALAATANADKRAGAGVELGNIIRLPYDGFLGVDTDSIDVISALLETPGSGYDKPAAIIIETVQCEGGLHVAQSTFLQSIEALCHRLECLLIVDDIQAGCGRTGSFFSFSESGIQPDIICLSKSLSGLGLPLSMVLIRPEIDRWKPGEHNGTFRGHNYAFVTAAAALEFWRDNTFATQIMANASFLRSRLKEIQTANPTTISEVRGRGMVQGLVCRSASHGAAISKAAFEAGLIVETCGPQDEVVKLLPPLTIDHAVLDDGLSILSSAVCGIAKNERAA